VPRILVVRRTTSDLIGFGRQGSAWTPTDSCEAVQQRNRIYDWSSVTEDARMWQSSINTGAAAECASRACLFVTATWLRRAHRSFWIAIT